MTLSYAEAMKKRAQQAGASSAEKSAPKPSLGKSTPKPAASVAPRTSAWVTPDQTTNKPAPARRSPSNPWGTAPTKPQHKSPLPSERKPAPKPAPKPLPQASTPASKTSTSYNNNNNKGPTSWTTVASSAPKAWANAKTPKSAVEPKAILTRQSQDRDLKHHTKALPSKAGNKPKGIPPAKKTQPPKQKNPQKTPPPANNSQKTSKKPKPKLKNMSIGDMISQPKKKATLTTANQQKQQQQQQQPRKKLQVDSAADFPALGAGPVQSSSSASPKVTAAWGAKVPPRKVAPKPVTASNATPAKQEKKPHKKKEAKKEAQQQQKQNLAQSAAMFFQPMRVADNADRGDAHQLLRLVQERKVYQKKGRQRVAPRKKKFTALKKKVLQERLDKWRQAHPEEAAADANADSTTATTTTATTTALTPTISSSLCIYRFASAEELEDDEEYEEIVSNLQAMATKVGVVDEIFIPRNIDRSGEDSYPTFVKFQNVKDASAAKACWDGLVIGGQTLEVIHLNESTLSSAEEKAEAAKSWSEKMLEAESMRSKDDAKTDDDMANNLATIVLNNVLTEDDFEDEDCLEESLNDLRGIAEQHGEVQELRASDSKDGSVQIVYRATMAVAKIVAAHLCETTVSGSLLSATLLEEAEPEKISADSASMAVILENVLTEDDKEDEDCLKETLTDIRELASRHGEVTNVIAEGDAVKVFYAGAQDVASNAASQLNGLTLGGSVVVARLASDGTEQNGATSEHEGSFVILKNILTEDDLEDDDCLQESLNDIRKLASQYGKVLDVEATKTEPSGVVRIRYEGPPSVAMKAASEFDGMIVGGQIISAETPFAPTKPDSEKKMENESSIASSSGEKRKPASADEEPSVAKKPRQDDKQPLYSGDKLIPERFAECKRVPKIPNAAGPREYAKMVNDERVRPLLVEMLCELMRLQKRAMEEKNAKAKRRIVMGLREVARGIRSHKVKMVVMANNLDEYGAIDEKLQEIIDLAHSEGVPLFFEFTKRSLGKAVGKSIKVAVVGIQNADGAHQPFKKLTAIAQKM